MPLYEYQCEKCGSAYEVLHLTKEMAEDVVCPECHSRRHKRLMSAASVAAGSSGADPRSCEGDSCCGGACEIE